MVSYADLPTVPIKDAREEIEFPIRRETAISEKGHLSTSKDVVIHDETDEIIGLVSKKRPNIHYTEIMDWLVDELNNLGHNYKLRESVLDKSWNFHQEYVIDADVDAPDGENISPIVFVKASYIGTPMQMEFGTFRYTCSNGAKVGNIIDNIKVSAKEARDLMRHTIRDEIRASLNKFDLVGKQYKELSDSDWNPYLESFILSETIPIMIRKGVLEFLAETGDVNLTVDKLKSSDLKEMGTELYNVVSDQSAWYLYNVITQIATHKSRGASSRKSKFKAVSEFFEI